MHSCKMHLTKSSSEADCEYPLDSNQVSPLLQTARCGLSKQMLKKE